MYLPICDSPVVLSLFATTNHVFFVTLLTTKFIERLIITTYLNVNDNQWWIFQFRGPRQEFSKIDAV